MKRLVYTLLVAGVWLPLTTFAALTNDAPSGISFQDFKIITQRNIFDPNRHAGSGAPVRHRSIDPARLARAEGFSLVGTLLYDREALAFFDGTDPKYRKVLKVANDIANYKITEVTATFVKLEANGNQVQLPVGMQMKKVESGEWQLVDGTSSPPLAPAETANKQTAESADSGSDSNNEIMKKLMQKRAKELNK